MKQQYKLLSEIGPPVADIVFYLQLLHAVSLLLEIVLTWLLSPVGFSECASPLVLLNTTKTIVVQSELEVIYWLNHIIIDLIKQATVNEKHTILHYQ